MRKWTMLMSWKELLGITDVMPLSPPEQATIHCYMRNGQVSFDLYPSKTCPIRGRFEIPFGKADEIMQVFAQAIQKALRERPEDMKTEDYLRRERGAGLASPKERGVKQC